MNFRMIFKTLGVVLMVEAIAMIPSLLVSIIYKQDDYSVFLITIGLLLVLGFFLYSIRPKTRNLYTRDGFAIVSIGWILFAVFGALPFYLSGNFPTYADAFFEAVSGFTTTGSSVLREVESLPRGILFWRGFTNWVGGMGVLVLTLAVLPKAEAGTVHIMKAESPGPNPGKLVPKMGQTAKILYGIYIILTIILILFLIVAGMPVYDSFVHAFATAGTGGFSIKNTSIGAYNNVFIEVVTTVFMFIFGVNFTLYYMSLKGQLKSVLKDEELRFYFGAFTVSILLITWELSEKVFGSLWEILRHASFQVSTIMTTTGFSSTDFNLWPSFSKSILVVLMFIGASAGSTAGGLKCIRIIILFKTIKREMMRIIHPRSVSTVKIGGKALDDDTLSGVMVYFFTSITIFAGTLLIVSLDGKDLVSNFTAVATAISNVGPGLGLVGPMGNFADYSILSKLALSFAMLFGRLEIFPLLILFTPTFWKKVNI